MKTSKFDEKFNAGEDITDMLDISSASLPGQTGKRVNVDFPLWMVQRIDREARRLGVTRHSLIKLWLAEKLDVS